MFRINYFIYCTLMVKLFGNPEQILFGAEMEPFEGLSTWFYESIEKGGAFLVDGEIYSGAKNQEPF